jgi:hypothetical protein
MLIPYDHEKAADTIIQICIKGGVVLYFNMENKRDTDQQTKAEIRGNTITITMPEATK